MLPLPSFIIVDESIPFAYWSTVFPLMENTDRLRIFIHWYGKGKALILNQDWSKFEKELDDKAAKITVDKEEIQRLVKEQKEHLKSFIKIQNHITEDDKISSKDNLIQLAKALVPLGTVMVITNKLVDKGYEKFDDELGKATSYTVEQFNDIVNREWPEFYEYVGKTYFDSN